MMFWAAPRRLTRNYRERWSNVERRARAGSCSACAAANRMGSALRAVAARLRPSGRRTTLPAGSTSSGGRVVHLDVSCQTFEHLVVRQTSTGYSSTWCRSRGHSYRIAFTTCRSSDTDESTFQVLCRHLRYIQLPSSYENKGRALVRSRVQGWARSARGLRRPQRISGVARRHAKGRSIQFGPARGPPCRRVAVVVRGSVRVASSGSCAMPPQAATSGPSAMPREAASAQS